ncbi:MAG: amidohydrolase family protein, partial [Planctomycetes bacterium]|nr:amidohydrolase family protein [Planctomycetota bacterium]
MPRRTFPPHRFRLACLAVVMPVAAAAAHDFHTEFETPIAITNATIHPGGEPVIENGTIVIENGRIVAVGTAVEIPPHAEIIDAEGMVVYPGFVSAHSHLGVPEEKRTEEERQRLEDENPDPRRRSLPRTRWANRKGVRPQYRVADHWNPTKEDLEKFRKSGFTTVLAAPREGVFSGAGDLMNLSGGPLRRAILAANVAQHSSFRTGEPGQYPNSLLGVFAQFRQVLLDTQWSIEEKRYFQRHPRKTQRPPVDPAILALRPLIERRQRVIFTANSEHEIRRALNLANEFDLDVIISGAKEAYKAIDRIKADNVPLIVSLKFDEEPEYGKKKDKKRRAHKKEQAEQDEPGESEEEEEKESEEDEEEEKKIYEPLKLRKERRRLWEEQVANIIKLHEAGVPFALSTRDFEKPAELIENLRLVMERGLPADAAVEALTRAPAILFGLEDQIGRIDTGYVANIVIMDKALEDEEAKVKYVLVDGEKFEFDRDEKKDQEKDEDEEEEDEPADTDDTEEEVEDEGPTWPCEIKADRIPKTQTGGNVLIRNATVITVSGPTLEQTSILVENGKIAAIGPDLTAPQGVTVIDATGRYVLPGFIDCHSHMAIDGVNEGAMAITAEVRVGDLVRNDSVEIYRALAGGATTTHAMHGSANPIGGQNVVFKLKYLRPVEEMILRDAPRTIKFALGENVKQSNRSKAWGKRFPNSRMGVESVIRDAFVAGRQYQSEWDEYRAAVASGKDILMPRRDLRLEAIADILRGDLWIHSHCYRSDEVLRLMAVAEDFGVRIAVLQHILEGYRIAPEIARHGAGASTFSNFWAYKVEAYGAIPHNAALMTQQGITSTINSDSANTLRFFDLEAAKSIKWGGLGENQALRLVTLNAAIQLGIDDRIGSIEVGKDADLAIFNGHPLNSYSKNIMTLIEGEVYYEDENTSTAAPAGPLDWNKTADMTLPESVHRLYAIVGGTVHPVSGDPIPNGTVVIRNDSIVAVGADVEVPPGAGIVNAQGLHVYPGIIDAGGSLGLTEIGSLRATRDNFDIATFAPELRTASAIHPHSAHIRIARTAGITSQLATPTGGRISGQSCVINLDGWTADEMLLEDRVALHMTYPSLPERLTGKDKKKRKKEHKEAIHEIEDFLGLAKRYAKAKQAAESDADL